MSPTSSSKKVRTSGRRPPRWRQPRGIAADGQAHIRRIAAEADAEAIKLVESERNAAESERIAVYRDLAPAVLMGLAAREFAGKIETIEHLNLTPDLLGTVLTDLISAGTRRLETGPSSEA